MDFIRIKWLLFSVLHLNARFEELVMAPNLYHSLFPISYLCLLTCITWKLQVMHGHSAYWMTALLSETFFVWFRVAWEIRLESYSLRHTSAVLQYNIVSVYCKPSIHRYLVCNYTWQQTSHTSWLHATHQTMPLLPMMHRFIKTKLASYTTCCNVFSINHARSY